MKLEQLTILPLEDSLILRSISSSGLGRATVLTAASLSPQGAKALGEFLAAVQDHLPPDPLEADISQVAVLESQLSRLREKVGMVAPV